MPVTQLETGMVFKGAKNLIITPYTASDTLGTTSYDIRSIVADSISIEQDDNTVNSKDAEFFDTPLIENTQLGKFQFSATCIDMQNTIMQKLFGCTVTDGGIVTFPSSYEDLYVLARIVFVDSESNDIIIPKLRLNSKLVIGTLKTGSAEGTIQGTAHLTKVASASAGTGAVETSMFMAATTAVGGTSSWFIKSGSSYVAIDY